MQDLVNALAKQLISKGMAIATAESCTGGLLASHLTRKAGASSYFDRGFITYSNEAKHEQLGVGMNIIETYGAVSEECAKAMAEGALKNSNADIAISITGIAGPDGGTTEKPLGTVIFGYAKKGSSKVIKHQFSGSREDIQNQSAIKALEILIDAI